jgi:hypothetical protein
MNLTEAHLLVCVHYYCSVTMDQWDVSLVKDFTKLFERESTFNEDLSTWNVSQGISFVSNDQGV